MVGCFERLVRVASFAIGVGMFAVAIALCTATGWDVIWPNLAASFLGASLSAIVVPSAQWGERAVRRRLQLPPERD